MLKVNVFFEDPVPAMHFITFLEIFICLLVCSCDRSKADVMCPQPLEKKKKKKKKKGKKKLFGYALYFCLIIHKYNNNGS